MIIHDIITALVSEIWELHVSSKDEVIECVDVVLRERLYSLILAGKAMRNSYPTSQDGRQMWDEAIKVIAERNGGKDSCQVCHGEKGGVPGNENIVGGVVMCDYCHAESLK